MVCHSAEHFEWNWKFLSIDNWFRLICISYFIRKGFFSLPYAHVSPVSSAQTAHHLVRSLLIKQPLFPLVHSFILMHNTFVAHVSTPNSYIECINVHTCICICIIWTKLVYKCTPTHASAIISSQLFVYCIFLTGIFHNLCGAQFQVCSILMHIRPIQFIIFPMPFRIKFETLRTLSLSATSNPIQNAWCFALFVCRLNFSLYTLWFRFFELNENKNWTK